MAMSRIRTPNGRAPFRKTALASAVALASGHLALGEESEAPAASPTESPTLERFIEESVVTAERRPELLGDVPLAVSVFTGEFIKDVNLDNPQQLGAFTPGLGGDSADSFIDVFQLRGIYTFDFGVGGDPSISFFKNGFYQGRNGPVITSFYDIDRVEVTRGPQGFLFGRNSIAGALNTITNRPQLGRVQGDVGVDLAEYGRVTLDGVANVPLGEQGAVRLAAYSSVHDGHVPDAFDPSRDDLIGGDTQAFRLSARRQWEATDVNAMVEHESREQSGTIYRPLAASWATFEDVYDVDLAGTRYESPADLADGEADDIDILSTTLEIEHDLEWATLTSLTGYRDHDYFYAEDFDGSPLRVNHYHQDQTGDYAEQELRLVSDDDGALAWYAGVSWYRENIDVLFTTLSDEDALCAYYNYYGYHTCQDYYAYLGYEFTPNPAGLVEPNRVVGRYSGWAAYVDLNLALSERFDVGVGLRHTSDTKRFSNEAYEVDSDLGPYLTLGFTTDGPVEATKTWRDLAPRALLRFRPNDDWTWYASVTRGYKSGGFGSFALEPAARMAHHGRFPPRGRTRPVRPGAVPVVRGRRQGYSGRRPGADPGQRLLVHLRGHAGGGPGSGRQLRRGQHRRGRRDGRRVGVAGPARPVPRVAHLGGVGENRGPGDRGPLRRHLGLRRQRSRYHAGVLLRHGGAVHGADAGGRLDRTRRGVRPKRGLRRPDARSRLQARRLVHRGGARGLRGVKLGGPRLRRERHGRAVLRCHRGERRHHPDHRVRAQQTAHDGREDALVDG